MLIHKLCTGEEVQRCEKAIIVRFAGEKRVLATAPHNGGLREDLTALFNRDETAEAEGGITMRAPTYAGHLAALSEDLGLDPATTVGISTAAQMENAAICTRRSGATEVTAIVTAGVGVNGGRVGDPASWDELAEEYLIHHGTINILLFISAELSPGAMARSLVTCTEAKTAALQELLVPSRYSRGLATGTGTDGTIIVSHKGGKCLENAGKHCKLGELIGLAVKEAVREALYRQSGLCPAGQCHVLQRLGRFGITAETLPGDRLGLLEQEHLVAKVSLISHLMDQLSWGLLSRSAVFAAAEPLLDGIYPAPAELRHGVNDKEDAVDALAGCLRERLELLLRNEEEA